MHSARIAGNERIAAGRLARCRSIVAASTSGGWLGDLANQVPSFAAPFQKLAGGNTEPVKREHRTDLTPGSLAWSAWLVVAPGSGTLRVQSPLTAHSRTARECIGHRQDSRAARRRARPAQTPGCTARQESGIRAADRTRNLIPLLAPRASSALRSLAPSAQPAWGLRLALEHFRDASGLPAPGDSGWRVGRWLPSWLQGSGTALPASTTTTMSHSLLASSLGKSATQQREQEQWN